MSSARLFQTIVVAGTSIGACASSVESVPHDSSGAATGAGGATTVSTGTVSASVAASSNTNGASTGSGVIVGSGGAGGAGGSSVTSPSDCANSAQFQCQSYVPAYTNCYCDPGAPLTASDCGNEPMFFTCYSYNPPIGCHCIAPIK